MNSDNITGTATVPPASGKSAAAQVAPLPAHLRRPRLRRAEAAEYLALVHGVVVAVSTLAKYASLGGGPPYATLHRTPYYRVIDLDYWVEGKLKVKT